MIVFAPIAVSLATLFTLVGVMLVILGPVVYVLASKQKAVNEAVEAKADAAEGAVSILKTELDTYKDAYHERDKQLKEANLQLGRMSGEMEILRERTDLRPVLAQLTSLAEESASRHAAYATHTEAIAKMQMDSHRQLIELAKTMAEHEERAAARAERHEKNAQQRNEKLIVAIEQLASHLSSLAS